MVGALSSANGVARLAARPIEIEMQQLLPAFLSWSGGIWQCPACIICISWFGSAADAVAAAQGARSTASAIRMAKTRRMVTAGSNVPLIAKLQAFAG